MDRVGGGWEGEFQRAVLSKEKATNSLNSNYFMEILGQSHTSKGVHGSLVRNTKKIRNHLSVHQWETVTQTKAHFQKESSVPI